MSTNPRNFVGHSVTLNGRRAIVTGRQMPFAQVASLDGELRAEWSWAAVERIVASGGAFQL